MTARKPPRPRTERPNTVSGLEAKRAELVKLRDQLEADLRGVTSDIDHLDAAILMFTGARQHERYIRRYRAKKGSVRRFVLSAFREATGPITTKMLTDAWCEARGLRTDDTTWTIIRNRLGATLTTMKGQGLVEGAGMLDGYKGWRLAQSLGDLAAPKRPLTTKPTSPIAATAVLPAIIPRTTSDM
jgi:hypothetical protein